MGVGRLRKEELEGGPGRQGEGEGGSAQAGGLCLLVWGGREGEVGLFLWGGSPGNYYCWGGRMLCHGEPSVLPCLVCAYPEEYLTAST